MKKNILANIIFFILLGFIFIPQISYSQEETKSCTQSMQEFAEYKGAIPEEMKNEVDFCKTYCSKMANFPQVRQRCGIEECNYMVANEEDPSPWCCEIAAEWKNKVGVVTNPLEPVLDVCMNNKLMKTDFVGCVNNMRAGMSANANCCAVYEDIKKYDYVMAYDLKKYCKEYNVPTSPTEKISPSIRKDDE